MVRNSLCGLSLLASCTVASPVLAGDKFSADGMFCKTPESATAFVHGWNGKNSADVANGINAAAGQPLCSSGMVLLEEVERTTKVTVATGTWQLVKVNIWGIVDSGNIVNFPKAVEAYTFIQVELPKLGQAI